jgi:hypothetical protein
VAKNRAWFLRIAGVLACLIGCVDLKPPALEAPDAGTDGGGSLDGGASALRILHAVPDGETLFGVWASSPSFAIAVGTSSTSFVVRDGAITHLGGNQKGRDYLAITGFAADDVYAVGKSATGGFVDHFDGVSWTSVFDAPVPLLSVWCTVESGKQAVLASGGRGKVYGWNSGASSWSELLSFPKGPNDPDLADGPRLWGISGRSLTDFTVVADGRLWHKEPDGVYFYDLLQQTDTQLRSVWQSPDAPTSVYIGTNFSGLTWFSAAVNGDTAPLSVLNRDESAPGNDKRFHYGVWGTRTKVLAVGDLGRVFLFDTGSSTSTYVHAPTDATLTSVWGTSLADVWIVGEREVVLHGSFE